MRKLRSNQKNLRDIRIAYIFLLSLALICAVMGMIATSLEKDLRTEHRSDRYASLSLCADSLHDWTAAATADARFAAALKFDGAIAQLPSEVDIAPLMKLSAGMRANSVPHAYVRTLEDTFSLLASVDYTDNGDASGIVGEMLADVYEALGLYSDSAAEDVYAPPPEVINYTRTVVNDRIADILGTGTFAPTPILSEEGDAFKAENDNMRMVFSSSDGSLTEFVHIHLGSVPQTPLTEDEQLAAALDFFKAGRRAAAGTDISKSDSLCGFTVAQIDDGNERFRITVDRYGRIWSFKKVKR